MLKTGIDPKPIASLLVRLPEKKNPIKIIIGIRHIASQIPNNEDLFVSIFIALC